jgi:hypothetical protein
MKTYIINDYDDDSRIVPVDLEYTEEQIIEEYWDFWSSKMMKKYGVGHKLITRENCIEDWLAVNWAIEKKENN